MKDIQLGRFASCTLLVLLISACAYSGVLGGPTPLSDSECLRSDSHTLHSTEEGYVCLPAIALCEVGFAQGVDKPSMCTSKTGCMYVPGDCFCPPNINVICVCGGGEPAMCI